MFVIHKSGCIACIHSQHKTNISINRANIKSRPFILDHGKASSDLPAGYGSVHVPMAPGMYELECPTWRPQGSLMEEVSGGVRAYS